MESRLIFSSRGEPIAFVEGSSIFSTEGSWAGFINEGSSVHDTTGAYVGLLLDDGRIAHDPTKPKPKTLTPPPAQIASHLPYTLPRRPNLPRLPKPYREAVLITPDSTRRPATFFIAQIVLLSAIGIALGAFLLGRNQSALVEANSFWRSDSANMWAALLSLALLVATLWFAASNVRGRQTSLFLVGAAKSRAAIKATLAPLVGQSIRYIEIDASVDSVDTTDSQVLSIASRAGKSFILFADHLDPTTGEFFATPNLHRNDRIAHENIVDIPGLAEAHLGLLLPDAQSTRDYFALEHPSAGTILHRVVTRWFDIIMAATLLMGLAPLILLSAVLIRLESPGPILMRQERVGLGGRIFSILRFRTMRVDAEKDGRPIWATARDSRVTTIGGILRRLRIDELPQLLNVLRSDMSFVGPRPERPSSYSWLNPRSPSVGRELVG